MVKGLNMRLGRVNLCRYKEEVRGPCSPLRNSISQSSYKFQHFNEKRSFLGHPNNSSGSLLVQGTSVSWWSRRCRINDIRRTQASSRSPALLGLSLPEAIQCCHGTQGRWHPWRLFFQETWAQDDTWEQYKINLLNIYHRTQSCYPNLISCIFAKTFKA